MENRRTFLKKVSALGGAAALTSVPARAMIRDAFRDNENIIQGDHLTLGVPDLINHLKPLEKLTVITEKKGVLKVADGSGRIYHEEEISDTTTFIIGGALGSHVMMLLDNRDRLIDVAAFEVDTKTAIEDETGEFHRMLDMLIYSCRKYNPSYYRMKGDTMMTYAGWFQDHVHVFKAMKYFDRDVTSGFDLWAMGQREDGMLADNCYQPWGAYKSWLTRFGERFVWTLGDRKESSTFYIRIPVENMSEFTFLEGIYYAWKATGDDAWMEQKLEHCIKAVDYATSDEYRWSEKYQLLKRGYTIDIWDFQPTQDIEVWDGDIMMAKPGVTEYSVMYGDNVGMSVGCKYLAEMLAYAGRPDEAEKYRQLGETLLERLNKLAWNGDFYTHHVQENPDYQRDFGDTPVDRQVTISNAYAINRRIGHEKAKAIIETYQEIRRKMPESSPGEWYLCYPPYETGWHLDKWEYMNGGVSSIVGGEVAHGAFEHGFEAYGADSLRRLNEMAQISDNFMKCIYRGAMPEDPERTFDPVDMEDIVNADTHGIGAEGVPGFTMEGSNDLSNFPVGKQTFHNVPFQLIDPAENGRRACLIISRDEGYSTRAELEYKKKASSFYIVHTQSGGNHLGYIALEYSDGSDHKLYVTRGDNIAGWWYPSENPNPNLRLAASVTNDKSLSVGAYLYGFNNPYPDKTIQTIRFQGADAPGKWIILGLTASDYPVYFTPSRVSFGAPDNWGAAAVIYALIEGLAGLKDTGIAFNTATLSPRWEAAGISEAKATAKYESSGGYLAYHYKKTGDGRYELSFTGTSDDTKIRVLLPGSTIPESVILDGKAINMVTETVEQSVYLTTSVQGAGAHRLKVYMGT
mgnify:CR=1 FL=1